MTTYAGTYDEHARRMLDWYGLRPSKAAVCLRVVLGKRCVAGNARANASGRVDGNPDNCLCLTVQWPHNLFDHVHIWLDQDSRYVMTTEPYDSNPQNLAEFTADMAELGVTVTVGDRSPWYPGSTTLLLLAAS